MYEQIEILDEDIENVCNIFSLYLTEEKANLSNKYEEINSISILLPQLKFENIEKTLVTIVSDATTGQQQESITHIWFRGNFHIKRNADEKYQTVKLDLFNNKGYFTITLYKDDPDTKKLTLRDLKELEFTCKSKLNKYHDRLLIVVNKYALKTYHEDIKDLEDTLARYKDILSKEEEALIEILNNPV